MTIGFIGQGYVGKNYADDFEQRGYSVVRYALEEAYLNNKDAMATCGVVFIAVPTPTTPQGVNTRIVEEVLPLVSSGSTVVIKSTLPPGTTARLQRQHPELVILFSPEFLSETTAAHDAAHPFSNIVGLAADTAKHIASAQQVHTILPTAPHTLTCSSTEAEIIKYVHNGSGYTQVVFFNMMYDLTQSFGAEWDNIEEAVRHNPFISNKYSKPVHKNGRGAGGNCFIKDFAALAMTYQEMRGEDERGMRLLNALASKNAQLLTESGKDLHILKSVHGSSVDSIPTKKQKRSKKL